MKKLAQLASRSNLTPISFAPAPLRHGLDPLRSTATRALHPAIAGLQLAISTLARQIVFPLLFLSAGLAFVQPCAGTPFEWDFTGSLHNGRGDHTATLLANGEVLVAGGYAGIALSSAEIYHLPTGRWIVTGSLKHSRFGHTATLLADGAVLVTGGQTPSGGSGSSEIYDSASGNWSDTGSLNEARHSHTATLLGDGKVLAAGGDGDFGNTLASAELYDPTSGTWTLTGSLENARSYYTATLLADGRVLVVGGAGSTFLASAELYDPATATWTATGSLNTARWRHAATLLADGRVLVTGGIGSDGATLGSAELYDPGTATWTVTGSLNTSRILPTSTLLPEGTVLVTGGYPSFVTAEIYDPVSGTWTATGSMHDGRTSHTATLLPNGRVLVAGSTGTYLASAELYDTGNVMATHVNGRGVIDSEGNQVTFNFRARQSGGRTDFGFFSFCDPTSSICVTGARITSISVDGSAADFSGTADLDDGTKVDFDVSVNDNGEPGTADTISLSLSNGYSAGGTLTSGDIRIY